MRERKQSRRKKGSKTHVAFALLTLHAVLPILAVL